MVHVAVQVCLRSLHRVSRHGYDRRGAPYERVRPRSAGMTGDGAGPRMRLVQVIDPCPGSRSGAAWCSSSCRHRAWELTRAAASVFAGVQVIDRVVQVERPFTVSERVEVEVVPHGPAWPHALAPFTEQVDAGRSMAGTLLRGSPRRVISALSRRAGWDRNTPPPTVGAGLDDRRRGRNRRHAAADVYRALGESAASWF